MVDAAGGAVDAAGGALGATVGLAGAGVGLAGSVVGACAGRTRPWGVGAAGEVGGAVLADGAVPVGGAVLADGAVPADGAVVGEVAGALAATGLPITPRKESLAVWPRLRAWELLSPGTVITRLLPSTRTSEPETPMPFTRVSMICRARLRFCGLGAWPSGVAAVSVTRVPPWRSIPSFGLSEPPPVKNTRA